MTTTNHLPLPFSSQWRDGHWQASDYASLAPGQRLARLNDILGKAHQHHMAEKANDQVVLEELQATMNAPPYVSAAWAEKQSAAAQSAASLPKKKKKKGKKKGKKGKKEQEEDFSAVAPGALPGEGVRAGPSEKAAPVAASPSESGAGREAAAEKSGSANSRFLQYMKLLVPSQKALPPPAPEEIEHLPEGIVGDTARAITSLAITGEYPISHRAGDGVPVAVVNIPQGSTIYMEHAWINAPKPLDPTAILAQYHALSAGDQALFDSLGHNVSANFIQHHLPTIGRTHPATLNPTTKEHAIIATWLVHQDPGVYTPSVPSSLQRDKTGLYPHIREHSRISCAPNCHLIRDARYDALVLRSARAISRGEPITYCPIADYTLFTHIARTSKLQSELGINSCQCPLCGPLPPAPSSSATPSKPTATSSPATKATKKGKGKAKPESVSTPTTAITTNSDALPPMTRVAIETRRQQAALTWTAWRALRERFWEASPTAPVPPSEYPDPRTIEILALRLDALLVDDVALIPTANKNISTTSSVSSVGAFATPMQVWFRSDVSHALEEVGDLQGALRWVKRELEVASVLFGLGHEGCAMAALRVGQLTGRVGGYDNDVRAAVALRAFVEHMERARDEGPAAQAAEAAAGGSSGGVGSEDMTTVTAEDGEGVETQTRGDGSEISGGKREDE